MPEGDNEVKIKSNKNRAGRAIPLLNRIATLLCLAASSLSSLAFPGETLPVTVGLPGFGPFGQSSRASINAEGRYVAFQSLARGLTPGDSNGHSDIFVRDLHLGKTVSVSLGPLGAVGNGDSTTPAISSDGLYVAFSSDASNLIVGDTNGVGDIFIRDLSSGTTSRVSVASTGLQGNNHSGSPCISADGRYLAFASAASNLVLDDTNGSSDIFLRDQETGTTSRLSLGIGGIQGNGNSGEPSISADGRYLAFSSGASNLVVGDRNERTDIFVMDLISGAITLVSSGWAGQQGNGPSLHPTISANGRYVAFESDASNLVAGDTNSARDVFVWDRVAGSTSRMSVGLGGVQGNGTSAHPSLSSDGRHLAFESSASNLVEGDTNSQNDTFVRDLIMGTTTRVSVDSRGVQGNGFSGRPAISNDGKCVAFESVATSLVSGDVNVAADIFVRDQSGGKTSRVSVDSGGVQGNGYSARPAISANGRYVAFMSDATNLVEGDTNGTYDIFVRDIDTATTINASVSSSGVPGNSTSTGPSISADGRLVVFESAATNLVPGDTNGTIDVFLRDLSTGLTSRMSLGQGDSQGNASAFMASISADGRYVAFSSDSSNLVPGDTNGAFDVFIRDLATGTTTLASMDSTGRPANGRSVSPSISGDGRYVVFRSDATNLVPGDTNGRWDFFLRDRVAKTTIRVRESAPIESSGGYSATISADGRYVAFDSDANNLVPDDTNGARDIFVWDRVSLAISRVSLGLFGVQGNGSSFSPSISADGRIVAFWSNASNLAVGGATDQSQIFVRDRITEATRLVSVNSGGLPGNGNSGAPAISGDGRYVAFQSDARNLTMLGKLLTAVDVFRHERHLPVGNIAARLVYQGWESAILPMGANYVLRTSTGIVVGWGPVAVSADGSIEIPEPAPGEYELLLKSWVFLQRKFAFTQASTSIDLGTVTLMNGDVDDDNAVTVFDYVDLSLAFDSSTGDSHWNSRADLDGDGSVTVFDYIILSENFDLLGEDW